MNRMLIGIGVTCAVFALSGACKSGKSPTAGERAVERILFEEPFEDTDWESRGWYDGPRMELAEGGHDSKSAKCCTRFLPLATCWPTSPSC